ncbi:MAG: 16S rRNA (cytosine(967)-C(5))-methyltransferase RsmB [Selenomonadaceae bacterium]|nr:16S rRNA (cytosine(967)-C(5))-methyltransferase RsmB [Selenomonadaceae bacterium]
MSNPRESAAKIVCAVFEKDAYANIALASEIRKNKYDDLDRRFLTEIVYGSVKMGITLDWILKKYVNRPMKKIPPMIRAILRISAYQVFFMDKVPISAVCNEAVKLTKKYAHQGTAGFVNAVVRAMDRERDKAKFPDEDKAQSLSLSTGHPLWIIKRWTELYGFEETKKLAEFDNTEPILSVRTNTLKITRNELLRKMRNAGIDAEKSNITPEGILITKHGALDDTEAIQKGEAQVQDESSMLVAHVLSPKEGEFIIDLCAAPGGKTTHIAALMNNNGRILATDVYSHKLVRIEENAKRLGIDIIKTKEIDGREIGKLHEGAADKVLVDAPCSGLGVLRRRPDARLKKNPEMIKELPKLQLDLLESGARAVKNGGVLVYSTCTIEPKENDEVIEKFLSVHDDFYLDDTGSFFPVAKRSEKQVQLLPTRDGTDGFFIARLVRKG